VIRLQPSVGAEYASMFFFSPGIGSLPFLGGYSS
jgi:hypothetical protein